MRALALNGFKEGGFKLHIGDACAWTICLIQKPAQLLCRCLPLWRRGCFWLERTKANGFSLQDLSPQDLLDHRFLRRR